MLPFLAAYYFTVIDLKFRVYNYFAFFRRGTVDFSSKWGVLILLSLAVFIIVIDTTIMNVAITALVHDLNTNIESIQLTIALYSLVIAAFTLTGAKLGDIIGMKKMFVLGTAIYGVGTIIAALSLNVLMLTIGWSVIEGIGAAFMI